MTVCWRLDLATSWRLLVTGAIAMCLATSASNVSEAQLVLAGSPGFDPFTGTGLRDGFLGYSGNGPTEVVNNNGVAVGEAVKFVAGSSQGSRGVRWDTSGIAAVELDNLGTFEGYTTSVAYAVNDAGTAVGFAQTFNSSDFLGERAIRWNPGGTSATALGHLGTSASGNTNARAFAINSAGTAVGFAQGYTSGSFGGERAVRWDASGTAATELGNLGLSSIGRTTAFAYAVNDAGTAVGYANKYVAGSTKGARAVRWDASGTAATELGNLGTDASGATSAVAFDLNEAGTVVGYALTYLAGKSAGLRAVRWDALGTTATELGNLGTDAAGTSSSIAYAVNASGTAVGYASKYISGTHRGFRAVRWNAGGTTATELANLTTPNGVAESVAIGVNVAGTAVGYSALTGSSLSNRAALWLPDASIINLNTLGIVANPADGTWLLTTASAITADGWVAGTGTFTPNVGAAYARHWVTQVGLGGKWTDDFTGNLNGTWGRGPQWSTGTPAMQVGDATFDSAATYNVTLDRNEATRKVAFNAGEVTLDLNGNTLTAANGLTIAGDAKLAARGTVVGDVLNNGTLAPGASAGALTIVGDLVNSGSVELELNGANAGQFDRLIVDNFSAGGLMSIILGYAPKSGDNFDILDFGSFHDAGYAFDFSLAQLPAHLHWNTDDFATIGVIRVVPEPTSLLPFGLFSILLHLGRLRPTKARFARSSKM